MSDTLYTVSALLHTAPRVSTRLNQDLCMTLRLHVVRVQRTSVVGLMGGLLVESFYVGYTSRKTESRAKHVQHYSRDMHVLGPVAEHVVPMRDYTKMTA